jgi:DNA-binding XRE family transcriptional regulator
MRLKDRQRVRAKTFPAKDLIKLFDKETTVSTMAEAIGTGVHTIYKWENHNTRINQWYADKYAINLGLHPSAIWADWFSLEEYDG